MLPSSRQFDHRVDPSQLPEWMDQPCSYEDFRDCLIDLAKVNSLLFAHRPVLQWLKKNAAPQRQPLHIVDVGCGGGDMLRYIADWAFRHKVTVKLTGVDMNPMAIRAAKEFSPGHPQIEWIVGQAQQIEEQDDIDIVTTSLCTHHMSNAEVVDLLQWMQRTARRGWFINDLRRNRMNYVLFKLLSRVTRWHRFVQHDGPVSIQRSFREADWQTLCTAANVRDVTIERFIPGRLCVSSRRD